MGLVPNARDSRPESFPPSRSPASVFTFGIFEFRPDTGELWKHGIRIKAQMKPLRVLEALLQQPGEVVTREQLIKQLWPAGTFVDFEAGLNTATNRLRTALGDSGVTPRYIETLPRLGYRFICPVSERVLYKGLEAPDFTIVEPRQEIDGIAISSSSSETERPRNVKGMTGSYRFAAAVLLMVAVILAFAYTKLL